jgi:hypothetical protein
MLENQLLKLSPEDIQEWSFILARLNLKHSTGVKSAVRKLVLKEGYSTIEPRGFIKELRRRLERLNRVHECIRGSATSRDALLDFIRLSRRECKLTLARYIFTPDEVVGRILSLVGISKGTCA